VRLEEAGKGVEVPGAGRRGEARRERELHASFIAYLF